MPPFIEEQVGVYPAESVLAIIKVRSWLSKSDIKEYALAATNLYREIYNPLSSIYDDYGDIVPKYTLLGFYDQSLFSSATKQEICTWMVTNARPLFGVCLVNRFSWLDVTAKDGSAHIVNEYNEETKAFIAILLDNIRTLSQEIYLYLDGHKDWLGIYTRDQTGITRFFQSNRSQLGRTSTKKTITKSNKPTASTPPTQQRNLEKKNEE
jgi:hypothetical protein